MAPEPRSHPLAAAADAMVLSALRARSGSRSRALNSSSASSHEVGSAADVSVVASSIATRSGVGLRSPPQRVYDARLYSSSVAPPASPLPPVRSLLDESTTSTGTRLPGRGARPTSRTHATAVPAPGTAPRSVDTPVRVSSRLARTLMLLETPPLPGGTSIRGVGDVALNSSSVTHASSSNADAGAAAVAVHATERSIHRDGSTPATPLSPAAGHTVASIHAVAPPVATAVGQPRPSAAAPVLQTPTAGAPAVPWAAPDAAGPEENGWQSHVGPAAELCASSALFSAPSKLPDILARYETRVRAILGPDATAQELAPLLEPARLTAATFLPPPAPKLQAHETVVPGPAAPPAPRASPVGWSPGDDDGIDGEAISILSLDGPHSPPALPSLQRTASAAAASAVAAAVASTRRSGSPELPLPSASELREFESASTIIFQRPSAAAAAEISSVQPLSEPASPPDALLLEAVAASLGLEGLATVNAPPLERQPAPQLLQDGPSASVAFRGAVMPSRVDHSSGSGPAARPPPSSAHSPLPEAATPVAAPSRTPSSQLPGSSSGVAGGSRGALRWLGLPGHRSPSSAALQPKGRPLPATPPHPRNLGASLAAAAPPLAPSSAPDDADALYEPTPVPRRAPTALAFL